MRLPVVPFIIAATLLTAAWYFFTATRTDHKTLDVPRLTRLVDVDGVETEVAIAPDGNQYAVVASGDLWVVNLSTGGRRQIIRTPEAESFPSWTPDGKRITFTRGPDTFAIDVQTGVEQILLKNATSLSWSATNRTAFVRDRALWIANTDGQNEKKLIEADAIPDVTIDRPRFSPDSLQVAYLKTQLGLRGEVWVADVSDGMARALVSDRAAENPMDTAWINSGRDLAYLTDRAGAYSLWYVDFNQSTINPLTQPLITVPLARIGMAVSKDRIVVPRHFVDSNIELSDGTRVADSEKLEFEPAASPDGNRFAYTIADENKFEIWTTGLNGEKPAFRALGHSPRFSPNGYEIVYTHTDPTGNADIWKLDIRNGSTGRLTDADEIDISPDWSPDGRSVAFASARGGAISLWTVPASGGKRLRINDGGYAPRFSPDSKSILFWNRGALWTVHAEGQNPRTVAENVKEPITAVWSQKGPAFFAQGSIRTATETLFDVSDRLIWPEVDVLRDGRFAIAPINIRETGLWAIDLTYKEN
jgi:Tol biopolymer transport system component